MKTTLITIALTSLITLNAHAATFIMQAHTPKGVQVLEGNKDAETPVVPEAGQPTQPSSNYIQVSSKATNQLEADTGYKTGYHVDSNCSYNNSTNNWLSDSSSTFFMISTTEGWFDYEILHNIHAKIGNTLYVYDVEVFSENYDGYGFDIRKIGHWIDDDFIFFYSDDNNNNQPDNGEMRIYLGEIQKVVDIMAPNDNGTAYGQICTLN